MTKPMQTYFEEWKFKHPGPKDFQTSLEKSTGKSLEWFFDDVIYSSARLDYKILGLSDKSGDYTVSLYNKGQYTGPVSISAVKDGKVITTKWYDGFKGKNKVSFPKGDYDFLRIDAQYKTPDVYQKNNTIRTSGIAPKLKPLRLQFLASIENPNKTQLFYTPIVGWNSSDNWMPGLALYNHTLLEKKIEYTLAPMYSTGRGNLTGMGSVRFNFYPTSGFQRISLGLHAQKFGFESNILGISEYRKVAPEIRFDFKKARPRSLFSQSLRFRTSAIAEYVDDETNEQLISVGNDRWISDITWLASNKHVLRPYTGEIQFRTGADFNSLATTWEFAFRYKESRYLDIRLFAGKYFTNNTNHPSYNWRMDGQSGSRDFAYDNLYLDRKGTDNWFQQQMIGNHGGFKVPTANGQSNDWLVATNIRYQLPIGLPIGVFADAGFADRGGVQGINAFHFDAGIHFPIIRNVFEIYVPLLFSRDINNEIDALGRPFGRNVRFTFALDKMSPFGLSNSIFN